MYKTKTSAEKKGKRDPHGKRRLGDSSDDSDDSSFSGKDNIPVSPTSSVKSDGLPLTLDEETRNSSEESYSDYYSDSYSEYGYESMSESDENLEEDPSEREIKLLRESFLIGKSKEFQSSCHECPFSEDYLPGVKFCGRCDSKICKKYYQEFGWRGGSPSVYPSSTPFLRSEKCLHVVREVLSDSDTFLFGFCGNPAVAGLGLCKRCMNYKSERKRMKEDTSSHSCVHVYSSPNRKGRCNAPTCRDTLFCVNHLLMKSKRKFLLLEKKHQEMNRESIQVRRTYNNLIVSDEEVKTVPQQTPSKTRKKCPWVMVRGKKRGEHCNIQTKDSSGYCYKHRNSGKSTSKASKSNQNMEDVPEISLPIIPYGSDIDLLNLLEPASLRDRCQSIRRSGPKVGQRCHRKHALGVKYCKTCMLKKSVNGKASVMARNILIRNSKTGYWMPSKSSVKEYSKRS